MCYGAMRMHSMAFFFQIAKFQSNSNSGNKNGLYGKGAKKKLHVDSLVIMEVIVFSKAFMDFHVYF